MFRPILGNREVTFFKAQNSNILAKSASKLLEPGHPPLPPPPFNVQKKVKLGENKTTSKLLDSREREREREREFIK